MSNRYRYSRALGRPARWTDSYRHIHCFASTILDRVYFLQERFAVLFGEGMRTQDLYRFNLVAARLGAGRATKLPLTRTEQLSNPNIGEGKETCPAIS